MKESRGWELELKWLQLEGKAPPGAGGSSARWHSAGAAPGKKGWAERIQAREKASEGRTE